MRHRKNKLLQIRGSVQKRDLVMRTMLTNLVRYGHLTTTSKKAKVLISYANRFFSKLVSMNNTLGINAPREISRWTKSMIFGNDEGKKVVAELLPQFVVRNFESSFLFHTKLGKRLGDAAEEIKIEIMK